MSHTHLIMSDISTYTKNMSSSGTYTKIYVYFRHIHKKYMSSSDTYIKQLCNLNSKFFCFFFV